MRQGYLFCFREILRRREVGIENEVGIRRDRNICSASREYRDGEGCRNWVWIEVRIIRQSAEEGATSCTNQTKAFLHGAEHCACLV